LYRCNAVVSERVGSVPLVRYFVVVAGVLLAMLAVANWSLPSPPLLPNQPTEIDKSTLRIRSERKWPQKIEFDTAMQPFIAPSAPRVAIALAAVQPAKPPLEALTQVKPAEPQITKPKPRTRTARRAPRSAPPIVVAANPTAPAWSFGWGEPVPSPARQSVDTHAASRGGMFGERNRQKLVSWSSGGFSDW
jgi:hypothetical protein